MSYLDNYILTCPECGHSDDGHRFDPSCADECFCPKCGEKFIIESELDEEEDEN